MVHLGAGPRVGTAVSLCHLTARKHMLEHDTEVPLYPCRGFLHRSFNREVIFAKLWDLQQHIRSAWPIVNLTMCEFAEVTENGKFCRKFCSVAALLTSAFSSKNEFQWTPVCQKAFEEVKALIYSPEVLIVSWIDMPKQVDTNVGAQLFPVEWVSCWLKGRTFPCLFLVHVGTLGWKRWCYDLKSPVIALSFWTTSSSCCPSLFWQHLGWVIRSRYTSERWGWIRLQKPAVLGHALSLSAQPSTFSGPRSDFYFIFKPLSNTFTFMLNHLAVLMP